MEVEYTPLEEKLTGIEPHSKSGLKAILDLDFTDQKNKFVSDPDFIGWTEENIDFAEFFYKNFLFLNLKYGGSGHLPPSTDIDDFWHGHISDTRRYAPDCERIFGYFLHHNPYFGIGTQKDQKLLTDSFERTQELHCKEFGAEIFEVR
ncbi:hypothetical protein MXMO3_03477 (plasmid) [Maritalea myrionectae]|uniref:Uncharacterized protein n=1 Tax=Maritalea myrionectae TaxID=454601 RepID=A0A2R4MJ43_9HYPH|nr:hypothetical protein [Maritalea myrionectae]AVX05980.1 hypothetical protein MXMO3_03477 [Maritalea myrionectae]